jgi:hypothetical protein
MGESLIPTLPPGSEDIFILPRRFLRMLARSSHGDGSGKDRALQATLLVAPTVLNFQTRMPSPTPTSSLQVRAPVGAGTRAVAEMP